MSSFKFCKRCKEEYENPMDRRFHAEPNACPECGPRISLIESGKKKEGGIERAIEGVKQGKIVALKGIGGFHLLCDARNLSAIIKLRGIKQRKTRPFA
jgi:hydrogenase maturation protein HypF